MKKYNWVIIGALAFFFCFLPSFVFAFPREELIKEIKIFEKKIGFTKDIHFHWYDPSQKAIYLCYYTESLKIPLGYGDDKMFFQRADETGCYIDATRYDVYFYKAQAVARSGIGMPITKSLLEEKSFERFISVIFHEDYHEEFPIPFGAIDESSAMIIGLVASIDFAREKFGEDSEVYKNLLREPEFYLQKSLMTNRYFDRFYMMYYEYETGVISKKEVLGQKEKLFAELRSECVSMNRQYEQKTFNFCPSEFNNAGLGFAVTYTRHYPKMYEAYLYYGKNSKKLFEAFQKYLPNIENLIEE